jgi:hypothetical protein
MWGALSGERTGLSFTIAAGSSQRSHSRVRVPWDLGLYLTVSDLRLPFSSPPTTHRVTVKVFDPASTPTVSFLTPRYGPHRKHRFPLQLYCRVTCFHGNVFTEPLLRNRMHNIVVLLLHACMLQALSSNSNCLQSPRLAMGLYTTI